jgi:hypothetical protein
MPTALQAPDRKVEGHCLLGTSCVLAFGAAAFNGIDKSWDPGEGFEILELSNNIAALAVRMNAALPTDRRRLIEDMDEEVANIIV